MQVILNQKAAHAASGGIAGRLIIVSNRLPVTILKTDNKITYEKSVGGLVAGFGEIYQNEKTLWIGHCGVCADEPGYAEIKAQLAEDHLVAVDIPKKIYKLYYNGVCNKLIWPLFHYFPEKIHIVQKETDAYQLSNELFCQTISKILKPGDKVWVQDYQLMLLPNLLRKSHPNLSIAYFHHIPFPSSEIFKIIQSRLNILEGLLGADIVGFHTVDYVRHFISSINRLLGCTTHLDEVFFQNRRIKVLAQPLGVDVNMIDQSGKTDSKKVKNLLKKIGNHIVFLGIDRLDYTKGIPERLEAFRAFLKKYPDHIGKVIFIQICVPTRTDIASYRKLRADVEKLVGHINGEFGDTEYTPIQYLYRSFTREEIIAFYKIAQVAVVTPLRDGLNLVCKEYVAAQSNEDGVLILSEMAGAAAEMSEALLVNPYDIEAFAETLHLALTMNPLEKKTRMYQLRERIIHYNNMNWIEEFLKNWDLATQRAYYRSMPMQNYKSELLQQVKNTRRCFLFLSLDQLLSMDSTLTQYLSAKKWPKNKFELTILSGQTKSSCLQQFGHLSTHLVAEQGAMIRYRNHDHPWQLQPGIEEFLTIQNEIIGLIQNYSQNIPGACIETKEYSIIWHYPPMDNAQATARARDLSAVLAQLLENTDYTPYIGQNFLEIRHRYANKGYAVKQILKNLNWRPDDLLITIGDNATDEEMYQAHPQYNTAIHVGESNLHAKFHLATLAEAADLLTAIMQCESR